MSLTKTVTMRISTLMLLAGMTALLLSCGLFNDKEHASVESEREAPPVVLPPPPEVVASAPVPYLGPSSLEERVFAAPVIARVRLDSVSSMAEAANTYRGTKYVALLEFSFSVLEYLKGSGADDIVGVWAAAPFFDTRQEAEDALLAIFAARDTRWDDHDAIVFLQRDSGGFLPSTQQASRYYLAWAGSRHMYTPDDGYSIASVHDKLWLPAAAAGGATSQPTGAQQRFLMDVPLATETAPTITLGEVKTRIATVTAKLAAGDGSQAYRECVELTYQYEGRNRYNTETGGDGHFIRRPDHEMASGVAASTMVYEDTGYGALPNTRERVWLNGGHANLFSVEFGDATPWDSTADGVNDAIYYDRRVIASRPLPAGEYRFNFNNVYYYFVVCDGYTVRYEWTVTVTAPERTLHELFFDPVTVGSAVAADAANGVLKPASFTGVGGAAATISRIAWESGAVTLGVTPDNALAGRVVDFIELDGTVSLSLDVSDASGAGTGTLRWAVASQPWEDGDTLMVRIREPLSCNRAVPDAANNASLVTDCKALVAFRDTLSDKTKVDWASSKPIAQWQGVTVGGTPKRVQRLVLDDLGLTGTLPADLGNLTGLTRLSLEYNSLSGPIPAALGQLTGLTSLNVSGNDLTGAIPSALGGLSRLTVLDLSDNELAGAPPAELGKLRSLNYLSLGGNDLTGPVPAWVSGLRSLDNLFLDGNGFTGPIPASLGQLTRLRVLALGRNQLTGGIPAFVTTLAQLEELGLARNQLTGPIPVGLLGLPDLEYLYLSRNALTGCVPAGLFDLTRHDLNRLNLPTCPNAAPTFGRTSYAFSVAANAAVGTIVGTVTATDADAGDAVTYAITAGNGGGSFAIDGATGAVRVAKALTSGTTHSLTVQASDRNRGAATVTVSITVGGQ